MNKNLTILGHFVLCQLTGAAERGLDADALLKFAGIDPAIMENPEERVPVDNFIELILEIWRQLDDELGGFASRPVKPGTFSMMCHATITCTNLRRTLLRGAQFFALISDEIEFILDEDDQEARLTVRHHSTTSIDNSHMLVSLALIWIRWACWMIDKKILLTHMNFPFPRPVFAGEYQEVFPCQHYFNQEDMSVVFHTRYLDMPVAQTPQSLVEFLQDIPVCFLTQYRKDDSISAQTRGFIMESDPEENLTLEQVASQLHLTRQTLGRRLKAEGNSFQEIKDSVRRDAAVYQLLRTDTPINDIARQLGFSEPSVFHRAFKKWTGFTPGAFREENQRSSSLPSAV